ncbi:uncharacterized protein LOC133186038 [Saccostrea echinata]|uniref:uncharacterized protein LOC133186038 n=1 Tax=Saccostrea echinata TaxID=191078 RepID=UPI002A815AA5|nr:uncharacterized protein LOC133186038 [Saccostrea echinata]
MYYLKLTFSVAAMLLTLSTLTEGSSVFVTVKCNRECTKEKLDCSNECRMGDEDFERLESLQCLKECKVKTEACEKVCACGDQCAQKLSACKTSCKNHTFQTKHDKRECLAECYFDAEQCGEMC